MSKELPEDGETRINNAFDIDRLIRIVLIAAIIFWSFRLILPLIGLLAWGFILAVARGVEDQGMFSGRQARS